ncbi:hypothetical protein SLEP1_g50215 [Rubroshorea leprosula]|uniref:Organ-specific protein S2-like n=1 Tax=Rubroshorea leprosula TaxID=152421 RepID=A0AAV5M2M6_9ROSI|nr:hypothetical protein SLEP1_g50215 [Rubroshorea leprosula]
MKSFLPFLTLFSFLLFVNTAVAARKDPGEYWRAVAKDQPLAEAIEALVEVDTAKKPDCHTPATIEIQEEKILVKDFETKDIKSAEEKSFVKDFEPRPNVSSYHDNSDTKPGDEKSFVKDFEPRPNVSSYHENGETKPADEKSFVNDFEPRPNVSSYHD